MSPHQTAAHADPRFPLAPPDDLWERTRDSALSQFVARRLSYIDATGCTEERRLAEGILEIYREWDRNRELARTAGSDEFAARISALGWTLRCLAYRGWSRQPGWHDSFHPQAVRPADRTEVAG